MNTCQYIENQLFSILLFKILQPRIVAQKKIYLYLIFFQYFDFSPKFLKKKKKILKKLPPQYPLRLPKEHESSLIL